MAPEYVDGNGSTQAGCDPFVPALNGNRCSRSLPKFDASLIPAIARSFCGVHRNPEKAITCAISGVP